MTFLGSSAKRGGAMAQLSIQMTFRSADSPNMTFTPKNILLESTGKIILPVLSSKIYYCLAFALATTYTYM